MIYMKVNVGKTVGVATKHHWKEWCAYTFIYLMDLDHPFLLFYFHSYSNLCLENCLNAKDTEHFQSVP